ncbi:MerR family transcriptional regulator [Janibacter sp. G349]|uniref:MerR family transcriptional regulator n=1 Tax=unclassified Janibacter TaxID=2649294 RepID=UPI003B787567
MTDAVGIAEVSRRSGLTQDTLRWYEREGLLPRVARGSDGRRRYEEADVRIVELIVRLRSTGMPVAEQRRFVDLLDEGAASHGRRMALLREHRIRVLDRLLGMREALGAIEDKIDHYERLIAAGLDCDETTITDDAVLAQQGSTR